MVCRLERFALFDLKPELLVDKGLSLVCCLHILINVADRNDKICVKSVNHVDKHSKEYSQSSILEVSQLDIHRTELDSPSDAGVEGRRVLKPQRVPVCRLQVLKVRVALDRLHSGQLLHPDLFRFLRALLIRRTRGFVVG